MSPRSARISAVVLALVMAGTLKAQDPEADGLVVRPPPPAFDRLESDENHDGVPDGWYNLRDGRFVNEGGPDGPRFIRFECDRPGRPARISRAFGVNGRDHEAVILGLWVRIDQIQNGERLGEEPGLLIDFIGKEVRHVGRGALGPWTPKTFQAYSGWTRVSKRVPVPEATLEAIISVGLIGATGVMDVDGFTFELIPRQPAASTNLVRNGDFERGDPAPEAWILDHGARRGHDAGESGSHLEFGRDGARALTGLGQPVDRLSALEVTLRARAQGLRGGGGAAASFFFLDDNGRILPGLSRGVPAFRWAGSFGWREDRQVLTVPPGAVRAVFQIEKSDGIGNLRIDDVVVSASPKAEAGAWFPYQVEDNQEGWRPYHPSTHVTPGSALDFSFLLDGPAGKHGPVTVKDGRFHFGEGGPRARFLGVQLLPPSAFLEPEKADELADRLARSGVNLVRFGDLDTPIGPDRSLFDDTREDTKAFDPLALARLDHLVAALESRGIYVAMELQGARRFRAGDGVAMPGALPAGGGPAALFDPTLSRLAAESARAFLSRKNAETGKSLNEDPGVAWVTLAGETSLFDMIENPFALPGDYAKAYRALSAKSASGTGRRFWQSVESSHWKGLAESLRKEGLKAPIAGVSHWRREPEFSEAQATAGLDLIDDRIYWLPPSLLNPEKRSSLWSDEGGLIAEASRKRKTDRPYVVGQWCDFTQGTWASVFDGAEQLLAARTAVAEDWDAIVRRGLFLFPDPWGGGAPGTVGGEDIYQLPAVANAAPHVFGLWPHCASILLRGVDSPETKGGNGRTSPKSHGHAVGGWEPERGRLIVQNPYTEGVAGWPGKESVSLEHLTIDLEDTYGVVVASSASVEPLATTNRLLLTILGKVEPSGFRWTDAWKRETADPGRPPLLHEPIDATVVWKGKTGVKAFALDNNGERLLPLKVESSSGGSKVRIKGIGPSIHWELVVE